MANRILPFMLAALACVALAGTSGSAAPAAEECLAKPKGPPPVGQHWYYQTNRKTQRKCWFLADEGMKTVAASPRKPAVPAAPADPDQEVHVQPPIANARAELIDQPRVEQPVAVVPDPQPWPEAVQGADDDADKSGWALASRWPDTPIAYLSDRATAVNDPAPAPPAENPPLVLAANRLVPVEQPTVAADGSGYVHLGQFAAALVVLIVLGGVILMSLASRRRERRNSSQHGVQRAAMQRGEMPWTGAATRRA